MYSEIKNLSLDDLQKAYPDVFGAFCEIFDSMEVHKRKHGRDYNEILVNKGKTTAVFFEGMLSGAKYEIEKVPEFLRKYAQDNDLLIINFGI